jgi:glycosyltransferase involved in cell wall biosynthesis
MYHSELIGLLLKMFYPNARLFWNIRCSTKEWLSLRPRNKFIFLLLKLGFSKVKGIVVNSKAEFAASIDLGYPREKLVYIPNGFELAVIGDKKKAREELLKKFNLKSSDFLIGMVARNDISKDHDTMLRAFRIVVEKMPFAHLILVGAGLDDQFRKKIKSNGLEDNVHIYGIAENVYNVIIGFDVATLSSTTESFPNVIAEYMLAELPVIATDVADISEILGDSGVVVPAGDFTALSEALISLLSLSKKERDSLGIVGRQRVLENFHIRKIYNSYIDLYENK